MPGPRCFPGTGAHRTGRTVRIVTGMDLAVTLASVAIACATALAPPKGAAPSAKPPPNPPGAAPSAPIPYSTLSGRPPEAPASRVDPRVWEVRFESSIWAPRDRNSTSQPLQGSDVMFWMPLVIQSTYSQADVSSVRPELWLHDTRQQLPKDFVKFRQGMSQGMTGASLAIPKLDAQSIKWSLTWRVQCWSSVVDDAAAARITWPAEWPDEARESLAAAPGFESGDPRVKAFVDGVSGGKLRSVTPWIAAKELVRATANVFKNLDEGGLKVENGMPRGIVFNGAAASMAAGAGTGHDLVAACVTVLRAAGIPARPVLGMAEVERSGGGSSARLVSWAELWLPQAGWVPFDPVELRSSARGGVGVERPWKRFGTWDGLNEMIPLCYGWALPVGGCAPMPFPAGFAWNATMDAEAYSKVVDRISLQITSRGRGK